MSIEIDEQISKKTMVLLLVDILDFLIELQLIIKTFLNIK